MSRTRADRKPRRREEAASRQAEYDARTAERNYALLDLRPGRSVREGKRLAAKIAQVDS